MMMTMMMMMMMMSTPTLAKRLRDADDLRGLGCFRCLILILHIALTCIRAGFFTLSAVNTKSILIY